MTTTKAETKASGFIYAIGGFVCGAVAGLLLAPKKGSELVADIGDWSRDAKEKSRKLYSQAKEYIPHRVR